MLALVTKILECYIIESLRFSVQVDCSGMGASISEISRVPSMVGQSSLFSCGF